MNAITAEPFRPDSLAEALEPEHGTKSRALATAWDRYCQHNNREQFNGEVRAIRGCVLIDFIEHRGTIINELGGRNRG